MNRSSSRSTCNSAVKARLVLNYTTVHFLTVGDGFRRVVSCCRQPGFVPEYAVANPVVVGLLQKCIYIARLFVERLPTIFTAATNVPCGEFQQRRSPVSRQADAVSRPEPRDEA